MSLQVFSAFGVQRVKDKKAEFSRPLILPMIVL